MKRRRGRKKPRFIRVLASLLALTVMRSTVAWAAAPAPGSLAVLEPPVSSPEMRAAWDVIRNGVYLDPLLLVRGREEVLDELRDWGLAGEAVRAAYRAADGAALDRSRSLIDEAWDHYYSFEYDSAVRALDRSRDLLMTSGDSGFRTRLMFELLLVRGIVARAAGDESYGKWFRSAAAVDPERELTPERYSPETIAHFNRLKRSLAPAGRVPVYFEGTPVDAELKLGGAELESLQSGEGHPVVPGLHFFEVSAPGYEHRGFYLEVREFEPSRVRFELVPTGPEGNPDAFFLKRLQADDRSYLALLAERLDVDYLLLTDPQGDELKAWLVNREGRTVEYAALWKDGEGSEAGVRRTAALLEPLKQELTFGGSSPAVPLSMPDVGLGAAGSGSDGEEPTFWKSYGILIGILLLAAAAGVVESGGGTRIEASW